MAGLKGSWNVDNSTRNGGDWTRLSTQTASLTIAQDAAVVGVQYTNELNDVDHGKA